MNARNGFATAIVACALWTTAYAAATTSNGPALAAHDGRLYLAFSSADRERRIHVARVDRDGKIHRSSRLSSRTSQTPALASYDGRLWMAFRSADRSGHIYMQSFDGSSWSRAQKLRFRTASGPALTEHAGRLHMVWRGASDDSMYHASFDGRRWSDTEKIRFSGGRGRDVERAPAIASRRNRLHLLFYGRKNHGIWVASMKNGTWDLGPASGGAVRLWDSARAPALTFMDDRLYAAIVAPGGTILLRQYPGADGWKSLADPDVRTGRRVAIAGFEGALYLARTYRGTDLIQVHRIDVDD